MVSNNNKWQFCDKAIKKWANDFLSKIDYLPNKIIKFFEWLEKWNAYKDWKQKYDRLPSVKKIDNEVIILDLH